LSKIVWEKIYLAWIEKSVD